MNSILDVMKGRKYGIKLVPLFRSLLFGMITTDYMFRQYWNTITVIVGGSKFMEHRR